MTRSAHTRKLLNWHIRVQWF